MSHFLDRLTFFKRVADDFADGHGVVTREDRRWEDGYRKRSTGHEFRRITGEMRETTR